MASEEEPCTAFSVNGIFEETVPGDTIHVFSRFSKVRHNISDNLINVHSSIFFLDQNIHNLFLLWRPQALLVFPRCLNRKQTRVQNNDAAYLSVLSYSWTWHTRLIVAEQAEKATSIGVSAAIQNPIVMKYANGSTVFCHSMPNAKLSDFVCLLYSFSDSNLEVAPVWRFGIVVGQASEEHMLQQQFFRQKHFISDLLGNI